MIKMEKDLLKEYFEEKYLKNSCFRTLDELLNDKTLVQINAPRALIAVELVGIWKGLNDGFAKAKEEAEKLIEKLRKNLDSSVGLINEGEDEVEKLKEQIAKDEKEFEEKLGIWKVLEKKGLIQTVQDERKKIYDKLIKIYQALNDSRPQEIQENLGDICKELYEGKVK